MSLLNLKRYGYAVLLVGLMTALTMVLFPFMGHSQSLLFVAAVMISSWYGGLGLGLLSAGLSVLSFDYFFDYPPYVFRPSASDVARAAVFLMVSLVISILTSHRKRAIDDLRRTNGQLNLALKEVKNLCGLIPICSYCKSVRNEQGSWIALEDYIRTHSDADFSHGICTSCAARHFPDLVAKGQGQKQE